MFVLAGLVDEDEFRAVALKLCSDEILPLSSKFFVSLASYLPKELVGEPSLLERGVQLRARDFHAMLIF